MSLTSLIEFITESLPNGGLIGIVGRGASGKTTLSEKLSFYLNIDNYHCLDEFILPYYMRYKMFDEDDNMLSGYHPLTFNEKKARRKIQQLEREVRNCKKTIYHIVEGVSTMHYGLNIFYDLKIFLDCSIDSEQERRRNRKEDILRFEYLTKVDKQKLLRSRIVHYNKFILPFKKQCEIKVWSTPNFQLELDFENKINLNQGQVHPNRKS